MGFKYQKGTLLFVLLEEKRPIGRFLLALAEGLHVRALRALGKKQPICYWHVTGMGGPLRALEEK